MSSNVVSVGNAISRAVGVAIAAYLRVKEVAGVWQIAGVADRSAGIAIDGQLVVAQQMSAQLVSPGNVYRYKAAAVTIAVGDQIWGAANGLATNVYAVGAEYLGTAETATAASGIFEVLHRNLRMVEGQATTVAASDTIVTGLSQVLTAVANLDSAPVLTCDRATASIGDQAGTPAAGSILLQTWMPTSVSNPTPIAATTFSKKVNWVAWGY